MNRPLPEPTDSSRAFWSACGEGRLVLQRCRSCQQVQFYPRSLCANCLSDDLAWIEASGRGVVYSYTVVHRALMAGFADEVPYVIALVQLDEGVRLMTRLVRCEPDLVTVGMPVAVTFSKLSDEITLPCFRPLDDRGAHG